MRKNILILFVLLNYCLSSQVSINTLNPNSSAVLDIWSKDKGVLFPNINLKSLDDRETIKEPTTGLVVYNINENLPQGKGLYINYGTSIAPKWVTFMIGLPNILTLTQTKIIKAVKQVNIEVDEEVTVDNIDLGLNTNITLEPMSSNQIIVTYSIPMGITSLGLDAVGYMGVRFMKDDKEDQSGSRKNSIIKILSGYFMQTITNTYVTYVDNNTNESKDIDFKMYGYVEQLPESSKLSFTFNMWSESEANYNWGKASMVIQVYSKKLN